MMGPEMDKASEEKGKIDKRGYYYTYSLEIFTEDFEAIKPVKDFLKKRGLKFEMNKCKNYVGDLDGKYESIIEG